MSESTELFKKIAGITEKFGINVYINVNVDSTEEVPDCIKEYVA
jgi:hypothetical protein